MQSQRHFQASLLAYIKIIEVLALLQPGILPAVRDAYSELVAEEIMSKRRMKSYFASLPGRTSVKIADDNRHNVMDIPGRTSASATHDLGDYTPVSLRHPNAVDAMMKPVKVEDIEAALSEMLPLVSLVRTRDRKPGRVQSARKVFLDPRHPLKPFFSSSPQIAPRRSRARLTSRPPSSA